MNRKGDAMGKRHFKLTWIAALVGSLWLLNTIGFAQQPVVSPDGARRPESVDVAYARAALKVAELELQRILKLNERLAGTYSEKSIELRRQQVHIAKQQLQQALSTDKVKPDVVMIQFAEAALHRAERDHQSALHLRERVPRSVSGIEVERLQWEVALCRLALDKSRQLSRAGSAKAKTEWWLHQLQKQTFQLQILVQDLHSASH